MEAPEARRGQEDDAEVPPDSDTDTASAGDNNTDVRRYTKEELLKIRSLPLSQRRPECVGRPGHASYGCWASARRPGDPPDEPADKRRPGDPRERLRKESEGIVLSPQRRSFNSGCFVVAQPPGANGQPADHKQDPSRAADARRIGSGRIVTRERDEDAPPEPQREDRFERRPFSRDFNDRKDRAGGRFGERRRGYDRDEEPEWFSGGPTSQNETIELRGFDEPAPPAEEHSNRRTGRRAAGSGRTPSAIPPPPPPSQTTPRRPQEDEVRRPPERNVDDAAPTPPAALMDFDADFDMDDILKLDLPGMNGEAEDGRAGGSRFSRWFKRESPPPGRRAAPDGVSGDGGPSPWREAPPRRPPSPPIAAAPPDESRHVFAPISPAASTAPSHNLLLEILQRGRQRQQQPEHRPHRPGHEHLRLPDGPASFPAFGPPPEGAPLKIQCLEELEARMRGPRPVGGDEPAPLRPAQNDSVAFQRLLERMLEARPAPADADAVSSRTDPLPMSLMQMLSESQRADRAAHEAHRRRRPPPDPSEVPRIRPPSPEDATLSRGRPDDPRRGASPVPVDPLLRPEAQAIISGLRRGEISPQNLYQQMGNPATRPPQREVLQAVLKLLQLQRPMPPRPPQRLSVSPLPPVAYCVSPVSAAAVAANSLGVHCPAAPQRIPSPRELQAHTQSIMQGALIKKKLEEQKENYRRRQEQAAQAAPASAVAPGSLAFTPTSVLRKMTAERDADRAVPRAVGWGAPPPVVQLAPAPKHGRPIVKGNPGGVEVPYRQVPPEYSQPQYGGQNHQRPPVAFPEDPQPPGPKLGHQSHHQFHAMVMQMQRQQQHHHHHQQQQQQQLHLRQQQHVPPPHPRDGWPRPPALGPLSQGPPQTPVSNQLARWFSPELLAEATAGKLPSVDMATNVLSLEELEVRMQHGEAAVRN